MGLHIMNYRAKLMGGSLDIESGDTGTCVTLKLPVSALHPPENRTRLHKPQKHGMGMQQ
jgi:signal transduction histidine kinase